MSQTTPTVDFHKVLEELKWEKLKKEFTWRRFFQTLLLVFAFSFLDVFTDFRFASSVDNSTCVFNNLSSPCGGLHSYQVHLHVHLPSRHHALRLLPPTEACSLHRSPSGEKAKLVQQTSVEGSDRCDVFPVDPLHDSLRRLCIRAGSNLATFA